jgi:hypothetical protein
MSLKWLPWRFIVRRIARRQGLIDPVEFSGNGSSGLRFAGNESGVARKS